VSKNQLYEQYKDIFNKYPNVIGIYWNDINTLERNIKKSILNKVEYNEIDLLNKEDKYSYINGDLIF